MMRIAGIVLGASLAVAPLFAATTTTTAPKKPVAKSRKKGTARKRTTHVAKAHGPAKPVPGRDREEAVAKSKPAAHASKPAVAYVAPQVREAAVVKVSARKEHPLSSMENAAALVPFFEQVMHPPASGSLHILQYGDSHTASDDWANAMRQAFQSRFGSGGPGFAYAGHPYRGYRRFDMAGANSSGWYADGLVGHPGDGKYGMGGVSLTAASAGETVSETIDCAELKLFYMQQPGGGALGFSVDGVPVETISTDGDLGPGVYRYEPTPGPHRVELQTLSEAPVRLFGWVAQNKSGITYETLGINGAQASILLDWDDTILASELAERDPALIIVAYGTNEALSRSWTPEGYRAAFSQVLDRLRRDAPTASILVVGPPDCEMRTRAGRAAFPHLDEVTAIQRAAAVEHRCAFWDWRGWMGGPGSVRDWVRAGLAQADYTHLTSAGYRLLGSMLFEEMMSQYDRFVAVASE
jgi:lysophospholipase L1-like esterase